MTRTPLFAFLLISILLTCSCSKSNNDTPTPTPPVDTTTLVKPDTLTAGWSKIKIDTTQILDIFFNNNTTGYAINDYFSLFKTTDGGLTWAIKNDNVRGINMAVTNNGNIHSINGNGTIHTSVDGGSNFSSITLSPFGESYDLFFPDDNNGFTVCGGVLFQTNNSGINWTATATDNDVVRQSLIQLFGTVRGERQMRPDYGVDFINKVFESNTTRLQEQIQADAQAAVAKYERRVSLRSIVATKDENAGLLQLDIRYVNIVTRQVQGLQLTLPLPLGG